MKDSCCSADGVLTKASRVVHHRGRSPQPLSIIELAADGTGIFPRIDLLDPTEAFAAWDDRLLIATQEMPNKASVNGAPQSFAGFVLGSGQDRVAGPSGTD